MLKVEEIIECARLSHGTLADSDHLLGTTVDMHANKSELKSRFMIEKKKHRK